ncbi:MAG: YiiX/YebB-like N1pC/P60 family cysteine hydrolase [Planctomycetota bacterium]|jgi:hypothetical protein
MHLINYTLLLISISVAAFGCNRMDYQVERRFILQPGDLLFQDSDRGNLCEAIEAVTSGYQGVNITHVGIVANSQDSTLVVIEAVSKGVQSTPLADFLNRSLDKNRQPKVMVGRLKPQYRPLIPLALKQAFILRGKSYDKVFAIDNDAYYCSELIYEIFLEANNNLPVFNLQPMTFKVSDAGQFHPVWEEYFSELSIPIPEGQPGINPGGVSRSPVLTIVHKYGNLSQKI